MGRRTELTILMRLFSGGCPSNSRCRCRVRSSAAGSQLVLGDTKRDPDNFDLNFIAKVTAGMSGSDIKEACRDAAMVPMREYIREHRPPALPCRASTLSMCVIRTQDFFGRPRDDKILSDKYARRRPSGVKVRTKSLSEEFEDAEEQNVPVSPDQRKRKPHRTANPGWWYHVDGSAFVRCVRRSHWEARRWQTRYTTFTFTLLAARSRRNEQAPSAHTLIPL